jgi:hypothetical protein
MATVTFEKVRETTTVTGTGTATLLGAVTDHRTFASAMANGTVVWYSLTNEAGQWEVGRGTYNAGTLARTTVLASSNAGALVNFSAGTKYAFCTIPAEALSTNLGGGGPVTIAGALTLSSAGTALSVTNNAMIQGILSLGNVLGEDTRVTTIIPSFNLTASASNAQWTAINIGNLIGRIGFTSFNDSTGGSLVGAIDFLRGNAFGQPGSSISIKTGGGNGGVAVEALAISATGAVTIPGTLNVTGITSINGTPAFNVGKLNATGTAAVYAASFENAAGSGNSYGVKIAAGSTSADRTLEIANNVNTVLFSIKGDGAVINAGTLTNTGLITGHAGITNDTAGNSIFQSKAGAGAHYWDTLGHGLATNFRSSNISDVDTTWLTVTAAGAPAFSGLITASGGLTIPTGFALSLAASTTGTATLKIPHGAAPTSPVNGDIWTTTAGLYVRINGATVGPLS